MEEGHSSSFNIPASSSTTKGRAEYEKLQKQHEEKMGRIEELKKQKEDVKCRLERNNINSMNSASGSEDKIQAFKNLSQKYNSLRDEYNSLLAEKSFHHPPKE